MSKFKLELEKETKENERFYRYRYNTCKIWFAQNTVTGSVYSINIENESSKDIPFYADDDTFRFYPSKVRFVLPSMVIDEEKDAKSVKRIVKDLCSKRKKIEKFILSNKHYKLWKNLNEQAKSNI